jgi:hypothetical protein
MVPYWWGTFDGDVECLRMYERHYPPPKGRRAGRRIAQFVGPGEPIVLRNNPRDPLVAMFVWRKFVDDCIDEQTGEKQAGVNCSVFRNEGPVRSSELVAAADEIADHCWSDRRHYTYVDPPRIRSTNPGWCFIKAGWRRCGRTKGGLIVLERIRP